MTHDGETSIISWVGNLGSAGAVLASLLGWLPVVGAVIAIIWYVIQITESETFKGFRNRRRALKIARVKAKLLVLETKLTKYITTTDA